MATALLKIFFKNEESRGRANLPLFLLKDKRAGYH
jgi:hypothetical protein